MSEKITFGVANTRQGLYEREIEALRRKHNMPVEEKEIFEDPAWKEIRNHQWEETPQVIGALIAIESDGDKNNYVIETRPSNMVTVYGTTVLCRKMKQVKIGQVVRITYLGEKKGQQYNYKDFKVEVKKQ